MSFQLDFDRLIDKEAHKNFVELIKCKICFNVLINPYDCTSCGNSFCYNCIENLIKNKEMCPFRCTSYTITPSSLSITSYLSKLNFECLNKANGCNEIIPYNNVETHDKECKFFYTTCPNKQCSKKMKWTLLENHLRNECEFSLFKCPYCDMKIKRGEYKEHALVCKSVAMSMPIVNNDDKSIEEKNKIFNDIMGTLPDIKDISMVNFLKCILFRLSINNKELNEKYEKINQEIISIKNDFNEVSKSNLVFFENINNELEELNKKIDKSDISGEIKENLQSSVNESIKGVVDQKEKTIKRQNRSLIENTNVNMSGVSRAKKNFEGGAMSSKKKSYSPKPCPSGYEYNSSAVNFNDNNERIKYYYNRPLARPFNTFSNFTNSNLITIIQNQEEILNKLSQIEKQNVNGSNVLPNSSN